MINWIKQRFSKKQEVNYSDFAAVYEGPDFYRTSLTPPRSIVIGRSQNCDVITKKDLTISRKHCEIKKLEASNCYYIRDLSSTRGTYVNGTRIGLEWVEIRPGAIIQMGDCAYCFEQYHLQLPMLRYMKSQVLD